MDLPIRAEELKTAFLKTSTGEQRRIVVVLNVVEIHPYRLEYEYY